MKTISLHKRITVVFIGMLVMGILMISSASPAAAISKTYTTDADFDVGILDGINHDMVHDQLQLNKTVTTFPLLWVANAGEDTISKIDTRTDRELARYRTWFGPDGQPGYFNHLGVAWAGAAPSRTAVDKDGNVYVANRHFDGLRADVVKILKDGFIDRNGNGVMDTSNDTNDNGVIDPSEIFPMGDTNGNNTIDPNEIQDERIAWIVEVGQPGGVGRSLAIDQNGNLWLGLYNSQVYYELNSSDGSVIAGPIDVSPNSPYGAMVDGNGTLWGASLDSSLLKLDTNDISNLTVYPHGNSDYGIALGNDNVYMGCTSGCSFIQFDPVTETFSFPAAINYGTLGIAVDANGNILVGKSSGGVSKFWPNGSVIWDAGPQPGTSEARGVQVDSDNNVWAINIYENKISKYNGTDGTPLGVFPVGNQPYTYSDATGIGLRASGNQTGTWIVTFDSGINGTEWGRVSWNVSVPLGASVDVKVRAAESETGLQLATYQPVNNGIDFSATGRFIQIDTRFTANPSKESPILYDLMVASITGANILGTKFNDSNGNGIWDAGESGVPGVGISLTRITAPGIESFADFTLTDVNGNYSFMNMQTGFYRVEENLSGFARSQTFPANGSPYYINFTAGNILEGLDFGDQPVAGGEIQGTKFNDSNGNGLQNIGESGISGITICLWPSSRCTITDGSGNYSFSNVPVGIQTVYEQLPPGSATTTPMIVNVSVNSGDFKTVNFGNRMLIAPPPDVTVQGATMVNGVPEVLRGNPVVIQKNLTNISNNVVTVNLALKWGDGTIRTAIMTQMGATNVWQAIFNPPFPFGAAEMNFSVDVAPAGPGPEDAIQIGDLIFVDPSGQIRDACTSAPINGATATLLVEFPPGLGTFIVSPPVNQIPPTNPLTTLSDGMYSWLTVPGTYKVRAEKTGYTMSESTPVSVPPPVFNLNISLTPTGGCAPSLPIITTHPANQNVIAGQNATFSVVATGASLSYQWQKNGTNIPGAIGASYTTPPTALSDSGSTFRVNVTNPVGSALSNSATLTVLPAGINVINNLGFESGKLPWIFYTNGTGNFRIANDSGNNYANISIRTLGTNMQLYQNSLALEYNTKYRLSFNASSTTGHDVTVVLLKHGTPYTRYGLEYNFDLSTTWQTYSVDFTTKGFTGTVFDGRLMFYFVPFAKSGDNYYIDDVRLEKI